MNQSSGAFISWAVAIGIALAASAAGNPDHKLKAIPSKRIMEDNGWKVEAENHNNMKPRPQCVGQEACDRLALIQRNCGEFGGPGFFGWNDEGILRTHKGASVSTEFKGYGNIDISFSNCGLSGTVSISMNGIVSASAEPGKEMLVGFDRKPGDVLEIKQHGDAIIKMDRVTFPRGKIRRVVVD